MSTDPPTVHTDASEATSTRSRKDGGVRVSHGRSLGRWILAIALVASIGVSVHLATRRMPAGPASGNGLTLPSGAAPIELAPNGTSAFDILKIATFNVRRGKGTDGVEDIRRIPPVIARFDVVGLNELSGFARGAEHQLELLARAGGFGFINAPTERRMGRAAFGNGLLSKLQIDAWHIEPLQRTTNKGYRNLLQTDVRWGDTVVRVLLTHLDRAQDREAQLRFAIDRFLAHTGPTVLMGDLNSDATDPQIADLLKRTDVIETLSFVRQPTPDRQIDWIFVRGLSVRDAGWEDRRYSDHPMLWAHLQLPTGRKSVDE